MIRPIEPADVPAVAALDAALFGGHAWSEQAWRQEAAAGDPDRRYLVLVAQQVIGYAGILRTGSDADILTVAVSAEHRRSGHGRALVESLLDIARVWRSLAVFLEVEDSNRAAQQLYAGFGFTGMGSRRHYYGTGRHGLTMRLQLREPQGSLPLGGQP